jgi:hypothetical protein
MIVFGSVIGSVVVVFAAGLLIAGWRPGYRPDLARVLVDGEQVVVRPIGMARILAFRRELRVDGPAIRQVRAIGRDALPDPQLRLVGTGMPGLQAGTFTSSHDGICFLLVGRAERFLRIDTDRGKIRCTVVQVRDPDLLVASFRGVGRLSS